MNDHDLIEYLRREEEGYLPEPPEGTWDGIADRLPSMRRRHVIPLWLRCASVAACIALSLGIGSLLTGPPTDGDHPVLIAEKGGGGNGHEEKSRTATTPHPPLPELAIVPVAAEPPLQPAADTATQGEGPATMEQSPSSPNESPEKGEKGPARTQRRPSRRDLWLAQGGRTARRQGRKAVSLSLYAAGIMASGTSSQGYFMVSDTASADAPIEGGPCGDGLGLNRDADMGTKRRHSLPVRAGVRVAIPISGSLAIESGLTCTRLSSSTESGFPGNYYRSEQTLHYIGIPVKLNCKLWQGKLIGVYVSGGWMVEKCVSGKVETEFVTDGGRNAGERLRVSEKPLQLSATLAAGIEADITKDVSLFFEPGASYYFDNHSGVDNAYKDKPFNLDLSLGIRISLSK